MTDTKLHLYEEIILVALHDEKGTLDRHKGMFGIAAAAFAELLMLDRIVLSGKRSKYIEILDRTPTGDPVLDFALERLGKLKKRGSMAVWLPKVANGRGLVDMVAQQLVADGILQAETTRVLGLFDRKTYPELDPRPEAAIRRRLEAALFDDGAKVDESTAMLIGLANGMALLTPYFGRGRMRGRKQRVKDISGQHAISESAKQIFDMLQAMAALSAGAM